MTKQTPRAIAAMRELLPVMTKMLTSPVVHESLRIQEQVINWDAFNAIEGECGVPLTPCPNSDVTLHLGLKDEPDTGQ